MNGRSVSVDVTERLGKKLQHDILYCKPSKHGVGLELNKGVLVLDINYYEVHVTQGGEGSQ